jgi:hypothetical protein
MLQSPGKGKVDSVWLTANFPMDDPSLAKNFRQGTFADGAHEKKIR